ncbi:MAG: hypothetical protein Q8O01_01100, partial [Candidatus Omnitrophota bacterium]|nr:hypothetical protein [Candidatus Omnitrophota bacterium]
ISARHSEEGFSPTKNLKNRSFGSPFQGSPQDDMLVGLLLKLNYYDQYHLAVTGRTARSLRKIILQVTQKDISRFWICRSEAE